MMLGTIDLVDEGSVQGWAKNENDGDGPVRLLVVVDDRVVTATTADLFRADLRNAGISHGYYGFKADVTGMFSASGSYLLRVVRESDDLDLPGSPRTVIIGQAGTPLKKSRSYETTVERATLVDALQLDSPPPLYSDVSSGLSVATVVQAVYRGVLNRDAEPRGLEIYGNALASGMLLADFISELIATAEFTERGIARNASTSVPNSNELTRLGAAMERAIMTLAIEAARVHEVR